MKRVLLERRDGYRRAFAFAVSAMLILHGVRANAQYSELHQFTGGPDDGANPIGTPIVSGGVVYGVTTAGGNSDSGLLYSMNADGSNFQIMHEFDSTVDGGTPSGTIVVDGSTIYGATSGAIFSVNTDGSNYRILSNQGAAGPLTLAGGTLYGYTGVFGTIFAIQTDGTNLRTLHQFSYNPNDLANPYGPLTISGSTIYGAAGGIPDARDGLYMLNTDGTGFQTIENDDPGPVTAISGALFGAISYGDDNNQGSIFRLNLNGTGFQTLHQFSGGDDNNGPSAPLTLIGCFLYGVTGSAGTSDLGTIFRMSLDGNTFETVYSFSGGPADGAYPTDGLSSVDSTMYGTTSDGGVDDLGTIYSFMVPEPASTLLVALWTTALFLALPRRLSWTRQRKNCAG